MPIVQLARPLYLCLFSTINAIITLRTLQLSPLPTLVTIRYKITHAYRSQPTCHSPAGQDILTLLALEDHADSTPIRLAARVILLSVFERLALARGVQITDVSLEVYAFATRHVKRVGGARKHGIARYIAERGGGRQDDEGRE